MACAWISTVKLATCPFNNSTQFELIAEVALLALAGTGRGDLHGFKGDRLVLSVAGTGDIVASKLDLNRLEGNIAGSGSLDLGEGSAKAMELNIAGMQWRP